MRTLPEVRLVEVTADDMGHLRGWRNDPDTRRWFFDDLRSSPSMQIEWWQSYQVDDTDLLYTIRDTAGTPVGTIGLARIDHRHETAELGRCMIGPPQLRGRGYMTAAVLTLCKLAFNDMGLRRLSLKVFADNALAIAVYERCGFCVERRLLWQRGVDDAARDVLLMALRAEEFSDG